MSALDTHQEGDWIARWGLPPPPDALPTIRAMLAEEVRREAAEEGDTLRIKELCVLLFAAGQPEDVLAIWRAKEASFDAHCSVDVQLLCGAGVAPTRAHLSGLSSEAARDALAYLDECAAEGDLDHLDEVLPAYRRYYGG